MPKLSQTSKMKINNKKVASWSLNAGTSCPGAKGAEVCESCYAKKGMYRFPVVKDARSYNQQDYHKPDWVDRMVAKVSKLDYFRWFDSGDIESLELAKKMFKVIDKTRQTKHWLPTRSDKVATIRRVMFNIDTKSITEEQLPFRELPNVAVRLSADNVGLSKPERDGVNAFVIRQEDLAEAQRRNIYICPVTLPGSTQFSCDWCTKCYEKDGDVAYCLHQSY